ncbi:hypothetical protein EDD69_11056 [Thermolongibacillus altinsuensis]|jgi:hypothetical protein|uniref:Uncharacterized protein n=1 Tax=Thermolongibacillus altinsuensis TaxID=575256 RepID=A0A4R1QKR4_9BACL|nr:hypothetical protein [Thermolongibacillus altinsuensis]TCL48050.1 hypothetical protein EDD69_11056 [Thermolongibacillus altinsuensis]GMB09666.1 hypothetical protein B1no1_23760 [Thermolongibacillus altinsuensis]
MTKKVNKGSENQNAPTREGFIEGNIGDNSKGRKQNKGQNNKTND